jgi:hypothetical protein
MVRAFTPHLDPRDLHMPLLYQAYVSDTHIAMDLAGSKRVSIFLETC